MRKNRFRNKHHTQMKLYRFECTNGIEACFIYFTVAILLLVSFEEVLLMRFAARLIMRL